MKFTIRKMCFDWDFYKKYYERNFNLLISLEKFSISFKFVAYIRDLNSGLII